MNIIRTSNPVLREKSFKNESEAIIGDGNVMTLKGVINKTLILFGCKKGGNITIIFISLHFHLFIIIF